MIQIAQGWELDVERGPDWLFVRPRNLPKGASNTPPLAEQIWAMLEQNFTSRLVLELDQVRYLHSYLIGQLVWLHKRISAHAGVMRICGLSAANCKVLETCHLDSRFPRYADRSEAVLGYRPMQPR